MKSGRIRRYFLTGLFVLIPIGASVLIVTWLFSLLDTWATPLTQRLIGRHIPGLGILITAAVILLTGVFSSNVIGRWILGLVDHLLLEVPVVKTIYNTMKQVMQAFSPGGAQALRSVVLVAHPRTGALSLGFVTHELEIEVEGGVLETPLGVSSHQPSVPGRQLPVSGGERAPDGPLRRAGHPVHHHGRRDLAGRPQNRALPPLTIRTSSRRLDPAGLG